MREAKEITIKMEKVDEGQYFCEEQRLSFDLPWSIYIVNGDLYTPYYRVYFGGCLMLMVSTERKCYEFIKGISKEAAHIAEMQIQNNVFI